MAVLKAKGVRVGGNERVSKLREKILIQPSLCIERGYWMTESYKETEGEPEVIRRAKALAKILENITIHVEDEEPTSFECSVHAPEALLKRINLEQVIEAIEPTCH